MLFPRNPFHKIALVSAIVWILCIVGVFAVIGYVVGIRKELFDETPEVFAFLLLGFLILGCLAFLVSIASFVIGVLIKTPKKQNIFLLFVKFLIILAFLPLYLLVYVIKPRRLIKKIRQKGFKEIFSSFSVKPVIGGLLTLLIVVFIIFPVWIGGYAFIMVVMQESLGYGTRPISISGTGSMFPTFPKGQGKDPKALADEVVGTPGMLPYPNGLAIGQNRFFAYEIGRGDIIVVESNKIREMTKNMYGEPSGWVKRIVGMPGDTIEIREGIVYLDGNPLEEPYIAQPRSTFGQTFLEECREITIPDDSVFLMGDNRKGSGDSREIGFVEINAINHVLPLGSQKGVLDKFWRDTAKDFDENSKIKIDKVKYLQLLNDERKKAGANELKYQPKLEASAGKRGEIIMQFNDFSFEATRSGYTMVKAMSDANYSNIVYGEAPTQGYYEAEEMIDNQFAFPDSKKFLLDKTYQEVGIAEVEGEINGCPTQVIVQHFAGYVPPNYTKADIDSWKSNLNRLRDIQPSWSRLKENSDFYQKNKADVDRINEIISTRISNISTITSRMESSQWLTSAEQRMVDQDSALYEEQESVASRLNSN